MEKHSSLRSLGFLILVGVVHWLLAPVKAPVWLTGTRPQPTPPVAEGPVEIVPQKDLERQVVRNSDAPSFPENNDAAAKYLSEKRSRVEKETRAPETGRFREAQGKEHQSGDRLRNGDVPVPGPRPDETQGLGSLAPQLGASPDNLKDVPEGKDTFLNTDEFVFASFLNRIADRIYDPWRRNVREASERILRGKGKLEPNVYVTELKVVLRADGKVTSISVVKSSGIPAFDEASKKAFWESEPFENPPRQMFDAERVAVLPYGFTYELRSSSFSILPGAL